MQNSGDASKYRALSPGCEGCDKLATAIEGFYAAGGSVSWGGWKILRIRRFDPLIENSYLVNVDSSPTTYRESSKGATKKLTGGPKDYVFELKRKGSSWVVVDKDEYIS